MNRKLLNGLLVLAVAAGGVGTFTSCKDEDFNNDVLLGQVSMQAQIDALRKVTDQQFENKLKELFQEWVKTVQGEPGQNALLLTLDPPVIGVNADNEGNITGSLSNYTSQASVFDGNDLSEATWTYSVENAKDGVQVKIDAKTGKITLESMPAGLKYGTSTVKATTPLETEAQADEEEGEEAKELTLTATLVVLKVNDGANGTPGGGGGTTCACKSWIEEANKWLSDNGYKFDFKGLVDDVVDMWDWFDKIKQENYDDPNVKAIVNGLYNMMFENIFPDQLWFKTIFSNEDRIENLEKRVYSIGVNQVENQIFGSFNLPLGIQSNILATYVYFGNELVFPTDLGAKGVIADASPVKGTEALDVFKVIESLNPNSVDCEEYNFTAAKNFGNFGGAVLTINPANNNYLDNSMYQVDVVDSKGNVAFSNAGSDPTLALDNYDGELYFGYMPSRAESAPGVYALNVTATKDNYEDFLVKLDKTALKDEVKDLIDQKDLTNVAKLAKTVYDQLNNKLKAYAVKVTWTEDVIDPVTKVKTGTTTNSVQSNFDLAAAVVHPLGYNTWPADKTFDPKFRVFENRLTYYLDKIKNKVETTLNLPDNFGNMTEVNVDFEVEIYTDPADGKKYVAFKVRDPETGELVDAEPILIAYDADGIDVSDANLNALVSAILEAMSLELESDVNYSMVKQLNEQLQLINDKLNDAKNMFNDYFDKIYNHADQGQRLLDFYNKIARHANNILKDPAKYFQVTMAYMQDENGPRFLSNDEQMPDKFSISNGATLNLFPTSYTVDMAVPSYKKYVAVTGYANGKNATEFMTDASMLKSFNTGDFNKVINGNQEKIDLQLTNSMVGKTLRVTYVSIDYRGVNSVANYYIYVEK